MLNHCEIQNFIQETKNFWCVTDFKREILDWNFDVSINCDNDLVIGHPTNSHKGTSVGDILPYTLLPEKLKQKYPNSRIFVPEWFYDFFKQNPFIDGVKNNVMRWGSLGTWGTTVQRTCNVWGIKTYNFAPKIYDIVQKNKNTICFCINSKTGGRINHLNDFEQIIEHLKSHFRCVQICLNDEPHLKNADEYIFNISRSNLIRIIGSFEYYIGAQNSIYHLAKSLGLKVVGILPENVDPFFVKLPLLTQINIKEIEMLTDEEKHRSKLFIEKMIKIKKNPDETHHIGWLYPDSYHLTMRNGEGTLRCPYASPENVMDALFDKIYPYGISSLWDVSHVSWS